MNAHDLELIQVPAQAAQAQRCASDPAVSAWVSANAGAGKTKVLTDRVLRLLLAGSPPGRILCLTFTKAAAANMAIRVFDRLGRWVTLDREALVDDLTDLQGRRPFREEVVLARRLFARAVETPGGLKIETIHAFCERLLQLAPFEANVPARFAVLDEERSDELLREATASVLAAAALSGRPELAAALRIVSLEASGDGFMDAVRQAVGQMRPIEERGGLGATLAALARRLGLAPGDEPAAIEAEMLRGGLPSGRCAEVADMLETSSAKTDRNVARLLRELAHEPSPEARLQLYRTVFFTEDGDPRADSKFLTKAVPPGIKDELLRERDRLCRLDNRLKAARTYERTAALFTLASEIANRVAATKTALGALDFEDLIAKTHALVSGGGADWVLYKLDRGIDHVLVDEAQDTSPRQWAILRAIADEFTAGRGARDTLRTLFAVGDPKQSIYGFQGAEPREFERTRKLWKDKSESAALRFEEVKLTLSFRSGHAVLSAVDTTFAIEANFRGLSFEDTTVGTGHQTLRPNAPGLVELWPIECPVGAAEPNAWALPVDQPDANAPPVVVARRIARAVRAWTTIGDETGRVWPAKDVLILVRKRGPAFEAVIRELKKAGVPVAGQDRLELGSHIAILDLVAVGNAALLPEDDLTLATALKTPLVGLGDDDLVGLAADRGEHESLFAALARQAETDLVARHAVEQLKTWRDLAAAHGPFAFYATLLGPGGARKRLVGRLGGEAADVIDEFLCLAHRDERSETPSLATFLARFATLSHAVKRDLDSTRDEVRVMTVHGAKGLEAPIVIVIDGCHVHGRGEAVLGLPDGERGPIPVWCRGKKHECEAVQEGVEARKLRELEEHNRLLYVAMTRAKDRLVIAPYRGKKAIPEQAWCEMVRGSLAAVEGALVPYEAPYGPVEVWRKGSEGPPVPRAPSQPRPDLDELPSWLTRAVPPEPEPVPVLRPSRALGLPAARTRAGPDARRRGTLVHALLERLPALDPVAREAAGAALLAARAPALGEAERRRILADVRDVLAHPDLSPLFGPESRAEAPIAGPVRVGDRDFAVSGQIDRLAVLPDEVLVADFKTARALDAGAPVPAEIAVQLALYRALLAGMHPDRRVRVFVVWTSGPVVRELGAELEVALSRLAGDGSAPQVEG